MNNYPLHPHFKRLIKVGLALLVVGAIAITIKLDVETGPDFSHLLTRIGFGMAILGWLVIIYAWMAGLSKGWIPLEPKLDEPRLHQQRKWGWVISGCLASLYAFWTWQAWGDAEASSFPIWIAIFWLPTLFFIGGRGSIRRALETQGNYPQDERERKILALASFYAFYVSIVILGLTATILYYAPTPSKFSLTTLFLTDYLFLFSARDFIAWKLGLR